MNSSQSMNIFLNLFIYESAGSSLLQVGFFLQLQTVGATLCCGTQAFIVSEH